MPMVPFALIALLAAAQSPLPLPPLPLPPPSLPPPTSEATSAPGVAEIHPTVAEIFKPPRLLGVRPRSLAVSATGRFVLWRHAQDDAEEPKLGWWLAPTDGSAEPKSLFAADAGVEAKHEVHVLHRGAALALEQVVDGRHHDGAAAVGRSLH